MSNLMKRLEELKSQDVLVLDVETNGLWGNPFAIGMIHYGSDGRELERFIARCPIETTGAEVDEWVRDNVLPNMESIEITHETMDDMLKDVFEFIKRCDTRIVCHLGHIVDAWVMRLGYEKGFVGKFEVPLEWYDIGLLVGTSVDKYNEENGVEIEFDGFKPNNPIFDCMSIYGAYRHFIGTV